ncbi:ArnT family glycosyltransferase [Ralstonia pseudosolanacearum]|uniref:ArnT family glycosyltransferase n=1 Tax=Ralstonia pseudosolanacearum TaxID=1310165 RepID=UPI001FFACB65|nr:glycosyltransferase family 39 protein [Ralstonia pseudosolanacearum]
MTLSESDGGAASRRLPLLLVRHWRWAIMLMVAAYFIAGTFWRAPWKADEPYSFGIVLNIIERGDWIVPNVAFEPFVEKPPLMYWSGALAALAVPELPPHEAVRLAVLFWMGLTCLAVWRTARLLRAEARDWRMRIGAQLARGPAPTLAERRVAGLDAGSTVLRDYALGALLLFVGCIGLTEHIHKFIADVPQLAGTALALYGLVRYAKACEAGGADGVEVMRPALWFGTGLGVAFLGKGVLVPGLFGLTVVVAMALLPDFRNRQAWRFYLVSLLAASPWLLIWPVLFWRASPDLFIEWFWINNIGRFFGFTHLGGEKSSLEVTIRSILLTGTPAVWPALGVLGVSLWKLARQRGRGARAAWLLPYQGHLVVALFVLATLAVVLRSAVLRDVYLMPLQPALALLGAPMLLLMPPAWRARIWGALVALFAAMALVVWGVWAALVSSSGAWLPGWLAKALGRVLPLPYDMLVHPVAVLAAVGMTALWAVCMWLRPARSGVVAWAAGIGLVWGLLGTLLMPWIDDARSYRPLFQAIKPVLESAQVCVATRGMGESERALMHYETGVRPVKWLLGHSGTGDEHRPNPAARTCDQMLVLEKRPEHSRRRPHGDDWELVWRGSRPGDTNETFSLFQRRSTSVAEALPAPEPVVPLTDTQRRSRP